MTLNGLQFAGFMYYLPSMIAFMVIMLIGIKYNKEE